MKIRSASFVVLLLLLSAPARADRHRADVFVGGFLAKGSDFKGWQLSGSWPILPCREWSLIVTYGRYYGTEDNDSADHTLAPYLIGGRRTFHNVLGKEMLPFVQVLVGAIDNIRELDPTLREVRSHKVAVFGAGIQPAIPTSGNKKNHEVPRLRVRAQADFFVRTKEDFSVGKIGGPGVAFSLGLVYQFGPEFTCDEKPDRRKKACAPSPPPPQARPAARLVPAERRGPPAPGERIAIGAR
jgi:hypothetical protein